jgi:hypothetical protein
VTDSQHAEDGLEARPGDRLGVDLPEYLHKIPNGYCGLGGTGISCSVGS